MKVILTYGLFGRYANRVVYWGLSSSPRRANRAVDAVSLEAITFEPLTDCKCTVIKGRQLRRRSGKPGLTIFLFLLGLREGELIATSLPRISNFGVFPHSVCPVLVRGPNSATSCLSLRFKIPKDSPIARVHTPGALILTWGCWKGPSKSYNNYPKIFIKVLRDPVPLFQRRGA